MGNALTLLVVTAIAAGGPPGHHGRGRLVSAPVSIEALTLPHYFVLDTTNVRGRVRASLPVGIYRVRGSVTPRHSCITSYVRVHSKAWLRWARHRRSQRFDLECPVP